MNAHIFREYDIRGLVDQDLTEEVVELLGKGLGTVIRRRGGRSVVVGRDCRESSTRFREKLVGGLSSTGLDPRYLELEMTESLLVQNAEENVAVLRKLGQEGVHIAVDDFGTGYSSLAYLRQLPIHSLKIDRSFVRNIEHERSDVAIVQAIVAMAHSLGLQVTAEGVETRAQLDAMARLGCDEYQGYLFSKPLPAAEIAARFLAPGELDFEVREAS